MRGFGKVTVGRKILGDEGMTTFAEAMAVEKG